jgi:N-sulfoglucosamine sulfohydrolase
MFLSDNGMAFPYSKTNCYLFSTRTPWIARWPGRVKPGSKCKGFISGIDYMPTMLGAVGIEQVDGMDGNSFYAEMCGVKDDVGGKRVRRHRVFTEFHQTSGRRDYPMRCVQNAEYGYIYNAWSDGKVSFKNESQAGLTFAAMQEAAKTDPKIAKRVDLFLHRVPEELYDLQADPSALNNLAGDPAHKQTLDEMRQQMRAHLKSVGDPILGPFEAWVDTGRRKWVYKEPEPKGKKGKQE